MNSQKMTRINDYEAIVGLDTIEELKMIAAKLKGKIIQNVNSTFVGGGVAEILNRMVPLLNQLGVDARWSVIKGDERFFEITKKMHNSLHGDQVSFKKDDLDYFKEVGKRNLEQFSVEGDIMFIHDPQPIFLVDKRGKPENKWVWRCHVDVSQPQESTWEFLYEFIKRYDAAVFSAPNFAQKLPIRQFLISPSIDPLSDKNRELDPKVISEVLIKYEIDKGKPIILQVSRFDHLKDPVGVIEMFEIVKRSFDCQLILAGGTADDDPESSMVLEEVQNRASGKPDIKILLVPPNSDIDINALQQAATVIVQKSIREGFGLTISEALWKQKPVVASAVGGIPLQVKNKLTGLLSHSVEGTAFAVKQLLGNPSYAEWLGKNGHEHVRRNYLITRHLKEYLLLFILIGQESDIVYLK